MFLINMDTTRDKTNGPGKADKGHRPGKAEQGNPRRKKIRVVSGYVIMGLSLLCWAAFFASPFVLEKRLALAVTPSLFIVAEVTFYLSLALLGKEIWQKIKGFFRRKKGPSQDEKE